MNERAGEHVEALERGDNRKRLGSAIVEALKHPMFLLIIGSLLTYLVVPAVTSKVRQNQAVRELKQKKALAISVNSIEFESKINVLRAMLETFHDTQIDLKLSNEEFHAAQMALVKLFNERRFALSEKEWWWLRDLQREAAIHKLIPSDKQQQFDTDVQNYIDNISKAHEAQKALWHAVRAPSYRPGDEVAEKNIGEIRTKMDNDSRELQGQRTDIIDRISRLFIEVDS